MNIEKPKPASPLSQELILLSRYLLLPMVFGMVLALVAYNVSFFKELWEFGIGVFHGNHELKDFALVASLGLLDCLMVGALLTMVTIGTYSIFIREIKEEEIENAPRFLKNLTSGILKIKTGMSLIAVSSIHLLKLFVMENLPWDQLIKKIAIHLCFICSAFTFAKIESLIHPAAPETPKH